MYTFENLEEIKKPGKKKSGKPELITKVVSPSLSKLFEKWFEYGMFL